MGETDGRFWRTNRLSDEAVGERLSEDSEKGALPGFLGCRANLIVAKERSGLLETISQIRVPILV
jgi:hypothetical protein